VSLSTLESALRFVEDVADTDDPADLGRRALPGLDRLVRADMLTYNELGLGSGQVSYSAYPKEVVFSPGSVAAFAAHMHENPLITHLQATEDASPMKISDFLSQERFHRLAVYTEFYRQVPVEHQMAFGWRSPAGPPPSTVPSPKAWSPPGTAAAASPPAPRARPPRTAKSVTRCRSCTSWHDVADWSAAHVTGYSPPDAGRWGGLSRLCERMGRPPHVFSYRASDGGDAGFVVRRRGG
jgi:hypothetical protein